MISPTNDAAHVPASAGSPAPLDSTETSLIGTLAIKRLGMDEAAEALLRNVRQVRLEKSVGKAWSVIGVNAQIATLVRHDRRFAEVAATTDLLYPDGISVVLAARLLGRPLKERIPGGELMELLCKEGAKEGLSVYFLGGLPGAAEKAAEVLRERYPGLKIAGTCCPPLNFEKDPKESALIVKSIQDSSPNMLFVALGVPRQEIWIADNRAALPVGLAFPVGAAFDTTAGLRKRAPMWARRTGTEWLYRLVMEPRRLWRRYLIGNTAFAMMVLTQWMRERTQRPGK